MSTQLMQEMRANHPLSREVRKLDLSEQEQCEIRFLKPNEAVPVDSWSYTFPSAWNELRFRKFETYLRQCAALNWVFESQPFRQSEA